MDQVIDAQVDLHLGLAASMRSALEVAEDLRKDIAERIKSPGFDEGILWTEWINEVISDKDIYEASRHDPAAAYEAWIDDRIKDPYRVSDKLMRDAKRRLGDDALRFTLQTWSQEIAWAHRMRLSPDADVALLCHMFLIAARKDTGKEFTALARAYVSAQDDMGYQMASEHGFTTEEVRFGYGSDAFGPLFLRHARANYASKLEAIDPVAMEKLVERVRAQEKAEVQQMARDRAVATLSRNRLGRMPGVIKVALELGLNADWLFRAEMHFLDDLRDGKVNLPTGAAVPYAEFIDWLRVQKFKKPHAPKGKIDNAYATMDVVKGTKAWIQALPDDYQQIGGADMEKYHSWMAPLVHNQRLAPEDLIMDYGFHLVERAFSRKAGV